MTKHDPCRRIFAITAHIDEQLSELYTALEEAGLEPDIDPDIGTARLSDALDTLVCEVERRVHEGIPS